MNRIEFYTKLNKAKDEVRKKQLEHSSTQNNYNSWFIKVDDYYGINQPRYFTKEEFDELRHSNEYGKQHYAKIENYYPDGRTRYFWSKEEWDAYQRIKQSVGNREAAERSAINKTVENNQREAQKRQNETTAKHLMKEIEESRAQGKAKNEAAAKALEEAEKKKYEELKRQNNPEQKRSREDVEREANNANVKNNQKEAAKTPKYKLVEQYENELTKLRGQQNLLKNRKFSQKGDRDEYAKIEERIKNKEKQLEQARENFGKEVISSREAAMKAGQKSMMDETKKYREEIERQKAEELNNWKKEKKDEVNNEFNKIYNAMKNIDGKNNKSLNIDNEYIDLIKEKVAEKDPDFNGDLDKYVTPVDNDNWFLKAADFLGLNGAASVAVKTLDDAQNIQEKHIKLVKGVLNELEDMIDNEIDSTTYEDERYDSYLNKLKKIKSEKKDKAITKDINTARLSLKKMYDGDSKNLDLDPSLMKALNDKLAQMDEEYNGNLYKYVRPYLFNTWIKDEESYDIVKKALDEIEKELRTANKNNEDYGEYIDKVSKILEA